MTKATTHHKTKKLDESRNSGPTTDQSYVNKVQCTKLSTGMEKQHRVVQLCQHIPRQGSMCSMGDATKRQGEVRKVMQTKDIKQSCISKAE